MQIRTWNNTWLIPVAKLGHCARDYLVWASIKDLICTLRVKIQNLLLVYSKVRSPTRLLFSSGPNCTWWCDSVMRSFWPSACINRNPEEDRVAQNSTMGCKAACICTVTLISLNNVSCMIICCCGLALTSAVPCYNCGLSFPLWPPRIKTTQRLSVWKVFFCTHTHKTCSAFSGKQRESEDKGMKKGVNQMDLCLLTYLT